MTELVSQLVAMRKSKGIKQATVARRMGVTSARVSHFERGRHESPTLSTLIRYAEAVGARLVLEEIS